MNAPVEKAIGGTLVSFETFLADTANQQQEPPSASRYRLLSGGDLRELPPLAWRVKGVLPAQGLAAVYGPSASGKSFLSFDMGAAIAEGRDWFGHKVKRAPVVYLGLEGAAGFKLRAAAWEHRHGRPLPEGMHLILQPFRLNDPRDVNDLAAALLEVGEQPVIFIDTLNRAAPGADENSSADMGAVIEGASRLQQATGGLVVLVHHSGKDAGKGMRGHSSLFAALDGVIEVKREGDRREWRVTKSKDGQDGTKHAFQLNQETLGQDEDGEPITSCIVTRDSAPQPVAAATPRLPKGDNQRTALRLLEELLRKSATRGRAGAPPMRPCVLRDEAVGAITPHMPVEEKRRKERAGDAISRLVGNGFVTCRDGWLWLP